MEERLTHAAQHGDIKELYELNAQDPRLLERIDDFPLIDTPLHIAATLGHTAFALEIMVSRPSFARKLNPNNLTPMHLALANGHIETARGLFAVDKDLVRVKGKEGKTALHFAVVEAWERVKGKEVKTPMPSEAVKERVDFLDELLVGSPDSLSDVTNSKETALHLAVKNYTK